MALPHPQMPDASSTESKETSYEVIIQPSRGWLRINWRELWEYRDLLRILVRRDFLAKYKQTVLGPLWFVIQPLLTALVMSIAFNRIGGVDTGRIPDIIFNLCALLPWSYFAQNVTTGAATFTANSHLFGKVYFPRLVVPAAASISNMFALALQFIVFVAFYLFYAFLGADIHMGATALLIVPLMMLTGVLSLGISLLIAASTAKYRDLSHLTPVLLQLWMFASPVFYPMTKMENHPSFSWICWANPRASIVQATRDILLSGGAWSSPHIPQMLMTSTLTAVLVLILGVAAFNRAERTVVDSV